MGAEMWGRGAQSWPKARTVSTGSEREMQGKRCERCGFESGRSHGWQHQDPWGSIADRSASLGAEVVSFGCSLHAAWQSDAAGIQPGHMVQRSIRRSRF